MFAIVEVQGKQYKVAANDKIKVDNLNQEVGAKIVFDKVFCVTNEKGEAIIGEPLVQDAKVEFEVIKNFKDAKVLIFKKRRRKNSRRKRGHRQQKTELKVLAIRG